MKKFFLIILTSLSAFTLKAQTLTVINNTAIPMYVEGLYTNPTTPLTCGVVGDLSVGVPAGTTVTFGMSDFDFHGVAVLPGGTFDAIIFGIEDFNSPGCGAAIQMALNGGSNQNAPCFGSTQQSWSLTIQPPPPFGGCNPMYSYLFPTYVGTIITGAPSFSGTDATIKLN